MFLLLIFSLFSISYFITSTYTKKIEKLLLEWLIYYYISCKYFELDYLFICLFITFNNFVLCLSFLLFIALCIYLILFIYFLMVLAINKPALFQL